MDNIKVAVGVIVADDRVLLVKTRSSSGYWTLPGGKVELNETVFDALLREIYEETGLKVESHVHLSCRLRHLNTRVYMVNYFLCTSIDDVNTLKAVNDEILSISWFPLREIGKLQFSSREDYNVISSICVAAS